MHRKIKQYTRAEIREITLKKFKERHKKKGNKKKGNKNDNM